MQNGRDGEEGEDGNVTELRDRLVEGPAETIARSMTDEEASSYACPQTGRPTSSAKA